MKTGLSGLLEFADFLKKKGITYSIHHYSFDSLTIFFTLVGARIEVQFTEEDWCYSVFFGKEFDGFDVDDLKKLIEKHWSDD